MKKIILFILAVSALSSCKKEYMVSGTVYDSESGEPKANCEIYIERQYGFQDRNNYISDIVKSNNKGEFRVVGTTTKRARKAFLVIKGVSGTGRYELIEGHEVDRKYYIE